MDTPKVLTERGLAVFTAMGRVVAAFASTEEAYNYAMSHPVLWLHLPNGKDMQAVFAVADGRQAFFDRAEAEA